MDQPIHRTYLASHGIKCECGCGHGFLDEHYRFMHYAKRVCASMQRHTPPMSFTCPSKVIIACMTRKKLEFQASYKAHKHWVTYHAQMAYTIPGIPNCTICKFGFMTKAMFVSHLRQTYHDRKNEASNIHAINMLNLGLLW
jgi:hypothetical protein